MLTMFLIPHQDLALDLTGVSIKDNLFAPAAAPDPAPVSKALTLAGADNRATDGPEVRE
jgi:hypothetical protein